MVRGLHGFHIPKDLPNDCIRWPRLEIIGTVVSKPSYLDAITDYPDMNPEHVAAVGLHQELSCCRGAPLSALSTLALVDRSLTAAAASILGQSVSSKTRQGQLGHKPIA